VSLLALIDCPPSEISSHIQPPANAHPGGICTRYYYILVFDEYSKPVVPLYFLNHENEPAPPPMRMTAAFKVDPRLASFVVTSEQPTEHSRPHSEYRFQNHGCNIAAKRVLIFKVSLLNSTNSRKLSS
jgi:hypothetical protein